jgi:hypothetical protein
MGAETASAPTSATAPGAAQLPTKAQWKAVANALSYAYGRAMLKVDGYTVSVQVEKSRGLRYKLAIYIDGWFKYEWVAKDCEERRRFYRAREVSLFSAKELAAHQKAVGKRKTEAFRRKHLYTRYEAFWPSFAPLKRHLLENNHSIEVLEPQL